MPHNNKKKTGYSLVELMVAVVIGVVISGGVMQFFGQTKRIHNTQAAKDELFENGRFAINSIKSEVQNVGQFGCASRWEDRRLTNTLNNSTGFSWNFAQSLSGNEDLGSNSWLPNLDASLSNPLQGDVLTLRSAGDEQYPITSHANATAPVKITAGNNLAKFDIVMASDCEASSIFQISAGNPSASGTLVHNTGSVAQGPGNATQDLGKTYNSNSSFISTLQTLSFYVRNNPQGIPALYRVINEGSPVEVIAGIENMQIQYGVDDNSDFNIDQYLSADAVDNQDRWDEVLALQISLLVRSLKDRQTQNLQPQSYTYNGTSHTPSDTYFRRVMDATINVRNRMP